MLRSVEEQIFTDVSRTIRASVTIHYFTQHNIPDDWAHQRHRCQNVQTRAPEHFIGSLLYEHRYIRSAVKNEITQPEINMG